MDILVVLALIAWFVLSAVRKKKQKEAAEAAKRAAMERASGQPAQDAAPAKPQYDAPIERRAEPVVPTPATPTPAAKPFDPFFGGLMDAFDELNSGKPKPQQAAAAQAATPVHQAQKPVAERMRTDITTRVQSGMQSTLRHDLEASSISGHAHTESSITGVETECAPEPARASARFPQAASAPAAAESAFTWDATDVTRGFILAEIVGKPKALQG